VYTFGFGSSINNDDCCSSGAEPWLAAESHNSIGVYLILIPKDLVSSSLIDQLKI
jgi:hypothetical protein